ncbi:MAG TPA: hypothetical protein PLR88_07755 [Bacteroidales bacterium]|nr:hypothetical protein [Bacteroidales bacterium]
MERFLIFIKHRLPFLWVVIEEVNNLLFSLLFIKKLDKTLAPVFAEHDQTPYSYRVLHRGDTEALYYLIATQDPADLEYFNPHGFDRITIERQFKNRSFLMMGSFDGDSLIGYFFLRFFINRKSFVGRLIDKNYRGHGIGRVMNDIMYNISWRMKFRCLSTISRNNSLVIKAHSQNHLMRVLKELNNNYLLVEFIPEKRSGEVSDKRPAENYL